MPPAFDGASSSTLARLGAARRLVAMDDESATELAVRYQLMSESTNYIVVHVRADAEKADDLPKVLKVPQVVAAGWHGMGTALTAQMRLENHDISDVLRTPSPGQIPARRFTLFDEPLAKRTFRSEEDRVQKTWDRSTLGPIGLTEFVELLNARPMPPFPTLDDFEAWGLPEAILVALRELAERGEDEEAMVLALLYLVSGSNAGRSLERQPRRQILNAYKTIRLDDEMFECLRDVFRSWAPSSDLPPLQGDKYHDLGG